MPPWHPGPEIESPLTRKQADPLAHQLDSVEPRLGQDLRTMSHGIIPAVRIRESLEVVMRAHFTP